jgi:choline dehydrogenase
VEIKKKQFDYIIVGAGSAGCVLANRLSADPSVSVLLVEAGPKDSSLFIRMPTAFAHAINSQKFDWNYLGEPEPYLDNRQLACPRGKVLGGSSSINAMCFVRGHHRDFDNWADVSGYANWSYKHCLPYFKKLETFSGGENSYRGGSGPVSVIAPEFTNPLCDVFAQACKQSGYDWSMDSNGEFQEGFGAMDQTIRHGLRESCASAYLKPIRKRKNLVIANGYTTSRVLLMGSRARGIEVIKGSHVQIIQSLRETILCAGAIESPKLLMHSGIGPAEHLLQVGVEPVHDLPGVGQNLQDHVNVNIKYESLLPVSNTSLLKPHRKAMLGLRWVTTRTGPGATNHFELAGYIKSAEEVSQPDLQLLFVPLLVDDNGKAPQQAHGFQVALSQLRSNSRGRIALKSNDPSDAPSILFNYLQASEDYTELRAGIEKTRHIFGADAFKPYLGQEIAPGESITDVSGLNQFIKDTLRSTKHPCGTCKMGQDEYAVVNDAASVHGIERLRVVDASIMPRITSGNTNAPTIMIAEKIADQILGRESMFANVGS